MTDRDEAGAPPARVARRVVAAGTDFEASYQGTPPWDIGRPQPALAEIAEAGGFAGRVLDVGCGTGEHALLAARLGFDATGIDGSPTAIAIAEAKGRDRGLTARFVVGDALQLGSLGEQFDTVIDSGLFHVFDDDQRARYVDGLREAVARGGQIFLLCFSDRVPGWGFGPRRIAQAELRASFEDGWLVESIDEARMIIRIAPDGVIAWRAAIRREN